jgi:uncharacterized protein YqeY
VVYIEADTVIIQSGGAIDARGGKLVGAILKEFGGNADGAIVKEVVDELLK